MLKCPHCNGEVPEELVLKHRALTLVERAKKKFGDKYNEEMKRRIAVRWKDHVKKHDTSRPRQG